MWVLIWRRIVGRGHFIGRKRSRCWRILRRCRSSPPRSNSDTSGTPSAGSTSVEAKYEKASTLRACVVVYCRREASIGDHLGQIYAKLGRKQEAAHTYRLAYSLSITIIFLPLPSEIQKGILQHYKDLMGNDANPAVVSTSRRPDGTFTPMPGEELSRMRSFKISWGRITTPATRSSALSFHPAKSRNVKYVSGSEALEKPWTKRSLQ